MPKLPWEFGIVGGSLAAAAFFSHIARQIGNANTTSAGPAAPAPGPASTAALANTTTGNEASWDEHVSKAIRECFGITATGSVYFVGIDALTLPTVYVAGHILGSGIGIWRGQAKFGRPARGMGTLLVGLTLVCPPYVRVMYAPWIFLSPGAAAWAGLTGGIIGVGQHLVSWPCAENEHEHALVAEIPLVPATVANKFFGAALVGIGMYVAAPGALRLGMMFGSG